MAERFVAPPVWSGWPGARIAKAGGRVGAPTSPRKGYPDFVAAQQTDVFGGRQNGHGAQPQGDLGSAIFTVDTHGRVLTWSPGAQQTYGYRPEDIVGRSCACFYMPDDVARGLPEHHLRKAAAGGPFSSEGWRLRPDGTHFWASVVIIPVRETNGALRGFSHIAREVTGRALSRAVLDSLGERICVLDREGSIVLTNLAWDEFAQASGADTARCGAGVNYLDVCRAATGPYSERAKEAARGIASVLRGVSPEFTLDYPCPSPAQKAWYRLTARPVYQAQNGAVILHSDITAQVRLGEELHRTQAHFGALLENPVYVTTLLDAGGKVRYQSPASEAVLGMRHGDVTGHPLVDFVHPADADAVRKLLRDCVRAGSKQSCQYRFRNRDGSWRVIESVATNLLSHPEGGIVLNSRDVTDQKREEKILLDKQEAVARDGAEMQALVDRLFRERDAERRRVAAALNGRLCQRLAALSLQASNLTIRAGSWKSRAMEMCLASLRHDLRHVADSLYPAMLEHLGLAVALRDYCAEFTRKQGVPVSYTHRRISTRLSGHVVDTLYRVATEALHNTARHAHAKNVWVTLGRTAKGTRLAVRDDGAGFDPAAVAPGSGLGLIAMRESLRAVKGSLWVRSEPGKGTEIVALVPPDGPVQGSS